MNRFSIKIKWTLVIVLLLISAIIFTGCFMLNGILKNQKNYYIDHLSLKSKDVNLFIRESYLSANYSDIKEYFLIEGEEIANKLKKILNLQVELYDEYGQLISNYEGIRELSDKNILDTSLNGTPVYEKLEGSIVYLAPVYDYDRQIGICKIQYNTYREDSLYLDMKSLYFKIGISFIIIISFIGTTYFSNVANNIVKLKILVQNVGKGRYENIKYFDKKDELEDLNIGIIELSNIIEDNINDLKNEKENLEFMVEKLKESEDRQNKFIGNITHEFKTPLTILKIQLDLISLYKEDVEVLETGKDIMNKEIKNLDKMVENILYLSKIQKYEYEFNKEVLNTKEILEEIIYRFKNRCIFNDIEIEYKLDDILVFMDKNSFLRIFINLLDNAIKYNIKNGKLIINSYEKEGKLYVEIKNTAIKINEDDLKKIFEPFFIIEASRNKKISGTGLGLPLVKNLVEKQGGQIQIKSLEKFIIATVIIDKLD